MTSAEAKQGLEPKNAPRHGATAVSGLPWGSCGPSARGDALKVAVSAAEIAILGATATTAWSLVASSGILPADGAMIALNVSHNADTLNPVVLLMIWVTALTAAFTAVYCRAKMLGKNPWLWLLLTMFPIMAIQLGRHDKVIDNQPAPKVDFLKTGALAFVFVVVSVYTLSGEQSVAATTSKTADAASIRAEIREFIRTVKLPQKNADEGTTMTGVRMDDDVITFTYNTENGVNAKVVVDPDAALAEMTQKLCGNPVTYNAIAKGFSIHGVYQADGATLGELTVSACTTPAPAAGLAYTYEVAEHGWLIIHAKGDIAEHEAARFKTWSSTLPDDVKARIRAGAMVLDLDSQGGVIAGANEMTAWVKDNKVYTAVDNGSTCASACVMIWGAGDKKVVGVNGKIGVHGASFDDKSIDASAFTVLMARTLANENAPAQVIAAVATTSARDMHWLDTSDAVAWGAMIIGKDGQQIATATTSANSLH
jgi:hypothetical protein